VTVTRAMGPRGAISPPMEEAAPVQLSKLVEHIGEPTLEGEVCLHLEHSETAGVMSQLMFQCLVGEDASASPPIGGVQLLQRNPGHNPHLLGWKVVPGPENKGIKKGHHDKIAHMWAWMPAHATSEILVLQNAWKKSIRNSFKQNHQNSTRFDGQGRIVLSLHLGYSCMMVHDDRIQCAATEIFQLKHAAWLSAQTALPSSPLELKSSSTLTGVS